MKKLFVFFAVIFLAVGYFIILGNTAEAGNYVVKSTNWATTGSCGASCTLRDALAAADADLEPSTITFDLSYPATISITSDNINLGTEGNLTIQGPGTGQLIIDGAGGNSGLDSIAITSNNNLLSGFTLRNSARTSISTSGSSGQNTFSNLVISDGTYNGLTLDGSGGGNTLESLVVADNGSNGIHITPSGDSNSLTDSVIRDSAHQGVIIQSIGNTFSGNTVSGSGYDGVQVFTPGATEQASGQNTISGNTINDNSWHGLKVSNAENAVTNNTLYANAYYQIYLEVLAINSDLSGNTVRDSNTTPVNIYYTNLSPLNYGSTDYTGDPSGGCNGGDAVLAINSDGSSSMLICDNNSILEKAISDDAISAGGFMVILGEYSGINATIYAPIGAFGISNYATCQTVLAGLGGGCDAVKMNYFTYSAGTEQFSWTNFNNFLVSGGTASASLAPGYSADPAVGYYDGYLWAGYGIWSSGNTFSNETLSNNGIGFLFHDTTADINTVENSAIDSLGQDVVLTDLSSTSNIALDNSSFTREKLWVNNGNLNVSQNLRTKVTSGVAVSTVSPLADATVTVADKDGATVATGMSGSDGYTANNLLYSYSVTDGTTLADDRNPFAVTATYGDYSGSATVELDGPDKEAIINLGVVDEEEQDDDDGGTIEGVEYTNGYIVTAPAAAGSPQIMTYKHDGTLLSSFMAYDSSLRGEFKAITADLRGTGEDEIITLPGIGHGPHLKVFKRDGTPLEAEMVFDKSFKGGLNAVTGDFNGDGRDEIAVAPLAEGGPQLKIYRWDDGQLKLMSDFFAYNKNLRCGLNLGAGDVDESGRESLLAIPREGGGPHLRIFKFEEGAFKLKADTFTHEEAFRGGTNVLTGDFDGDNRQEIIVSPLTHGGPNVRAFEYRNGSIDLLDWHFPYDEDFHGGINITAGDINADAHAELVVSPLQHGGPNLRVYSLDNNTFDLMDWLYVYDKDFHGGLNIKARDLENDGRAELVVAPRTHGGPNIRIYHYYHQGLYPIGAFWAYDKGFHGGVNIDLGKRD
ncbi:right-handed parallel beta-helix repeat-containing protein [Patescibacteria group bacterium]|nr:right-handed parallel beta-helix repeat-containing protein [Patescibacteria group bacterium]